MPAASERRILARAAVAVVPLLLISLYPLQKRIENLIAGTRIQSDELLFTSGKALKNMSLGYSSLLADIYWTRAVQYFGGHLSRQDDRVQELAPLLDVTTTLDPQLIVAYRFGGIFLAEERPVGVGRPDLGVRLLQKGIAANPANWHLRYDLGLIYYWNVKDYKMAAQSFWDAGNITGAPEWLKQFAASVAAKGVSRQMSEMMWAEAYQSASDPRLKDNALLHLSALKTQDDLDKLREISAAFRQRFGRPPVSGEELYRAQLVTVVPKDPAGYTYLFDPDGEPHVDPASPEAAQVRQESSREK
jgi:hypothetical protein